MQVFVLLTLLILFALYNLMLSYDTSRHWLQNYAPKHVTINLADNNIVYSTGVGTVVFSVVINRKTVRPVVY